MPCGQIAFSLCKQTNLFNSKMHHYAMNLPRPFISRCFMSSSIHSFIGVPRPKAPTAVSRSLPLRDSHFLKSFPTVMKYSQVPAKSASNLTSIEKIRKFWNGPNFKYWFIGVTAFSAWLFYYSLNSYKSTRVDISLPLAIPNHALSQRKIIADDILDNISNSRKVGGKIKIVMLNGPVGSGKSLLANLVAERLVKNVDWNPIGLPKSHIKVFLNADTLKGFYFSLQAFAAQLKLKPAELKGKLTESNSSETIVMQCRALLELIKEKLEKHPDWVIVIDNLRQDISMDVADIIKDSFIDAEKASSWSRGIVLVTCDSPSVTGWDDVRQMKIESRMTDNDAIQLLKDITNIQENSFEAFSATKLLLNRIHNHPLSIVCAGIILKHHLKQKELKSIDGEMINLVKEITENSMKVLNDSPVNIKSGIAEPLIIAETLIAMASKLLSNENSHIIHAMDLISSCAPRTPVPSTFIKRYLQHPFLNLPPIVKQPPSENLQQIFRSTTAPTDGKGTVDESLEPKGKAWSNKNLADYITRAENWFTELWQALKEVYSFYYGKQGMDDAVDDSFQILHDCELILSWKMQPGDVDSYTVHPLVYAVLRQNFLASTVNQMESRFIGEDEAHFNQQPWYKKMSNYNAKLSLQRYRNDQQKISVDPAYVTSLLAGYNNDIINVRAILEDPRIINDADLLLNDEDKLKYVQSHLHRIIHTLSENMRIAKQSVGGKTESKYLGVHGEYLQKNHPIHVTGLAAKVTGLLLMATNACAIDNDTDSAISYVENALSLLKNAHPVNELEVAGVLNRLAALHNAREELEKAKECLEEAVNIYEAQRRKEGEYKRPLDFGKALGALGVIHGTRGDRRKSKELIERGLMLQQTGAPDLADEAQSKHFGAQFASALTDLGHAYVSLGLPLYGKKILDLSLMAHKNLHGEKHPEVVRTLTVLSIAHLMQGHNEESKKLRKEAGKLQAQINILPNY